MDHLKRVARTFDDAGAYPQWAIEQGYTPVARHAIDEGDEVIVYPRGQERAALVLRFGRKNAQVAYVTPSGIREEAGHGWTPMGAKHHSQVCANW